MVNLAAIKLRALILVGEQIICLGRLRELLSRLGVIRIAVRMELLGELAIRALDLFFRGRARHAKGRIGI